MARRLVSLVVAALLPLVALVTVESGTAGAQPPLPGIVSCKSITGTITFTPSLRNGGTSPFEVFTIHATLGSTTNPCMTNVGITERGSLVGYLVFVTPPPTHANACATYFSAPPPPVKALVGYFSLHWVTPPGASTTWYGFGLNPLSVLFAPGLVSATISGGLLSGSFTGPPPPVPMLTIGSGTLWPGAILAGCASSTGLSSLPISSPPSFGIW